MPAAALVVVLLLTWLVYQPGLRGGFLFDDFGTLPKIAERGDLRTFDEVKEFVLSGIAGPTGRPIALASFLLDDGGWPSDPARFKRTNLLLHLLCGLLVSLLALAAGAALKWDEARSRWLAVLAGAIWSLHPLMVSTTLYVVQRMTILSALFQLAGLLIYTRLRLQLSSTAPARAMSLLVVMAGALALSTVLAILSKENGALLPLLALVIELTVFANTPTPSGARWRAWKWIVLGGPALLIAAFLIYSAATFGPAGIAYRGFTITQRVLSEGRVLVSYLFALVIPRLESGGLYHDDFVLSTSPLAPPSTLLCWLLIGALLFAAWRFRRRWPLWSCAILFFFAGHLLESTLVPLELYFEHRNYLPAIFLAIAASGSIVQLRDRQALAAAAVVVAVLGALTAQRASLWGDTDLMLLFWAERQPTSERAQLEAAQVELRRGRTSAGLQRMDIAIREHPPSVPLLTVRLSALCALRKDQAADADALAHALGIASYGPNTFRAMENLFQAQATGSCVALQPNDLRRFALALQENATVVPSPRASQQARFLLGLAELRGGHPDQALQAFAASLTAGYEFEPAMRMVAELAGSGALREALVLLTDVEGREADASAGHAQDIAHLRQEIQQDLDRSVPR
jgi:hypothetical protein